MQSNEVSNMIRKARLEQKITRRQLADKLGISDKSVSKWERGTV